MEIQQGLSRSVALSALCALGISCHSSADLTRDSLATISVGCGSILNGNRQSVLENKMVDGSTVYFGEKKQDHYANCRVAVGTDNEIDRIQFYDESSGRGVSDSCVVSPDFVSCNGEDPVADPSVLKLAGMVSSNVKYWLGL